MTGREGGSPFCLITIVTAVTRPQPRGRQSARAIPRALLDLIPFYFIPFFYQFSRPHWTLRQTHSGWSSIQRSVENWLTDAEKFEPQLLSICSPSHSYRTSRPIKLLGQGYLVGNGHSVLHATFQTPFKSITYSAGQ